MGIVVAASGLVTLEADESHESWPAVQRWFTARKSPDVVTTKFSNQELANEQPE
jgi:hypothetical protein